MFKPYLATARMRFFEIGYFGLLEMIGQYLLRATGLAAQLMIWRVLLEGGAEPTMTLSQLYVYTIVSSALEPVLNVRTEASSWLHNGQMLGLFQRPSPLFGQLAAHAAGGLIMPLALYGAPVLALSALLGVPIAPQSGWFYLSLPLCVSQGLAIDLLFACLVIRMGNLSWTVHSLREALGALLTGALIPFAALPWGLGDYLSLSPLGTLSGAPLALISGLGSAARLIPAQLFWNLTLWPLAVYLFGRSRERMVSFGG